MMYIFFYLDPMVVLSCQFEMNVDIMLQINKMVQYGCVKSTREAIIPLVGKRKRGIWENKSYIAKCQP